LRVRDIEFATRMLTVSRAVVEVNAKFHPAGGRFLVKDYPKDGEYRRLKLTSQIATKIQAYVRGRSLSDDDLLFATPERGPVLRAMPNPVGSAAPRPTMLATPIGMGCSARTRPDAAGVITAGAPSPSTARSAARLVWMTHACREPAIPMATSRATGFVTRSGGQRWRRPG
jgi:hypothetical protein